MEYISDIDIEKETMELRLQAVDDIFVKMSQMRVIYKKKLFHKFNGNFSRR